MATKSKKKKVEPITEPIGNVFWPKVTKGSHLTVYEMEDGRRLLEWNDEQLLKDVQAALASVK